MTNRIREKLGQALSLIGNSLDGTGEFPHVLVDRTVFMALIAILFLSIGVFTGCHTHSAGLALWSVVLAVLVLGRCAALIYTVKKHGYGTLEGKIEKVHDIPAVGVCMVTLVLRDGQKTKLLLGTQRRFRTGAMYRFYFSWKEERADGGSRLDAGTGNSIYLGCEECGN